MSSSPRTHNRIRPSLSTSRGARSVRLRMAADQERADRIRALKLDRPDLTWRRIADHVGVTERSAADWQVKGGIDYSNAEKLAELFEVDVDYIWRGSESTPSPFEQAAPVEVRLDAVEGDLATILAAMTGQLTAQTEVLSEVRDLLQDVKDLLGRDSQTADRIEAATGALDGSAERLDAQVRQTIEALEAAPQAKPAKARKRAPKHTPQA
jgi:hypothetical protein